MSHTKQSRSLPDGFERTDSTSELCLYNEGNSVVITVHERDTRQLREKYPYVVRVSVDQRDAYSGVFKSRLDAQAKAYDLADKYAE